MPPADSLDLFGPPPGSDTDAVDPRAPLAERMRPRCLDEMVGQEALLRAGSALRSLVASGALPSMILWGPPGSGKTTLARALARDVDARFVGLSAVMSGVAEIRQVAERARRDSRRTLLFLDELHRLNRTQQDALLPHVETGTVTLVGATTENPSFEVIAPLLSRCRVFTLERLGDEALAVLVRRAAGDAERGLGQLALVLPDEAVEAIAAAADGDARRALGVLEAAAAIHRSGHAPDIPLPAEAIREAAGRRLLHHDRDREEHYNVVSALIKSLRASDPDAALYYAARMLDAGEDPLFVARRLVIFASEDVGNADPAALGVATSAHLAVERIGMPEGRIPLAQAVTYLACAPKSNAAFAAFGRAGEAVARHGSLPVPMHLRNAPTALMEASGYGRGYQTPHDAPDRFVATSNLPEGVADGNFYTPTDQGAEGAVAERLATWRERRQRAAKSED
ncbi:MAG: replication-associated recombination protein A [Myxococcota bacterium]